jgi:hypothetical protein
LQSNHAPEGTKIDKEQKTRQMQKVSNKKSSIIQKNQKFYVVFFVSSSKIPFLLFTQWQQEENTKKRI